MIDDNKKKKADEERMLKAIGPSEEELEQGKEIEGWLKEDRKSADLSNFKHKQNAKDTKSLLEEVDEIDSKYDLSEYEKLSLKMSAQNMANQNDLYESIQSANAASNMSLGQKLIYLRDHNPLNAAKRLKDNTKELLNQKAYSLGKWYGIIKNLFGLFSSKISKMEVKTRNKADLFSRAQHSVATVLLSIFGGEIYEGDNAVIQSKKDAERSLDDIKSLRNDDTKLKKDNIDNKKNESYVKAFGKLAGINDTDIRTLKQKLNNITIANLLEKGLIEPNNNPDKPDDVWKLSHTKDELIAKMFNKPKDINKFSNWLTDYINDLEDQEQREIALYNKWGLAELLDEKTKEYMQSNPENWDVKLAEDLVKTSIKDDKEFMQIADKVDRTEEEQAALSDYLLYKAVKTGGLKTGFNLYSSLGSGNNKKLSIAKLNRYTEAGKYTFYQEGDKYNYYNTFNTTLNSEVNAETENNKEEAKNIKAESEKEDKIEKQSIKFTDFWKADNKSFEDAIKKVSEQTTKTITPEIVHYSSDLNITVTKPYWTVPGKTVTIPTRQNPKADFFTNSDLLGKRTGY